MTTRTLALVFMTVLSISTLFAATTSFADMVINNTNESISVNWKNQTQQTIHIKIVNANQEVIQEKTVENQTEFATEFKVSSLQNGHYTLVVTKKSNRVTQPFSLQKGRLILSETDRKVTYFPALKQKNNYFDISVFLGYEGTITVNVLDADKHKVLSKTYPHVSMLHKRFNMSDITEGIYKVEIVAGDETFSYSVVR